MNKKELKVIKITRGCIIQPYGLEIKTGLEIYVPKLVHKFLNDYIKNGCEARILKDEEREDNEKYNNSSY